MQEKFCRAIASFVGFLLLFAVPPLLILVSLMSYPHVQASTREGLRALARNIRRIKWSDYPPTIAQYMQEKLSPAFEKINAIVDEKYANQKLLMALSSLAVVGSVVLLIVHVRGTDTVEDYLAYCFKQIGITVVLGISITTLAWVLLPLKRMFDNLLFKLVASFVVSLAILFSRLLATDFFSTHFPFPPSYMTLAYGIGTGVIAAALTSIIFASLTLLFEILALLALSARDLKTNRWATFALAIVAGIGLFGAQFSFYALFEGINPKGQLFMVKIAEKYDFTTNHMCEATSEESVLFIENVSDRAIAATFPGTAGLNPQTLSADSLPTYLPKNFRTVRCNPLPPVAGPSNWCKDFSRFGFCETND